MANKLFKKYVGLAGNEQIIMGFILWEINHSP